MKLLFYIMSIHKKSNGDLIFCKLLVLICLENQENFIENMYYKYQVISNLSILLKKIKILKINYLKKYADFS
jgi:hypothetical protein